LVGQWRQQSAKYQPPPTRALYQFVVGRSLFILLLNNKTQINAICLLNPTTQPSSNRAVSQLTPQDEELPGRKVK